MSWLEILLRVWRPEKKTFIHFWGEKSFPSKRGQFLRWKLQQRGSRPLSENFLKQNGQTETTKILGSKFLSLSLSLPPHSLSLSFFLSFSLSSSSLDISLSLNLTNLFVFLCWCCRRQSQPQETVEHAKHAFYQIVIRFHQIFYFATTFIKRSIFLSW